MISLQIQCIVFDKTGTLTEGKPSVTRLVIFASGDEQTAITETLCLIGGAEASSEHPIANAITEFAKRCERALGSPSTREE